MVDRARVKAELADCITEIFGTYSQSKAEAAAERILLSFKGRGWEVMTWGETERLEDLPGRRWD